MTTPSDAMRVTGVLWPGEYDGLRVQQFVIDEAAAKRQRMRAMFNGGRGVFSPGTFTKLVDATTLWMSDTPDELADHASIYYAARGRVLINGLGLGCVLHGILGKPSVTHVDVVEYDDRVLHLVGRQFTHDSRVHLHEGDAYTYQWPTGTTWDVVWHDIWPTISGDNWPGMVRLIRRYANRCGWQSAWVRQWVRELARDDRRYDRVLSRGVQVLGRLRQEASL